MNYFSKTEEAYILKYEILVSFLIENNFSAIDEAIFVKFLDESLENSELKDFIINTIIDKAKFLQKIILPTDEVSLYTYSRFVKSLCKIKSHNLIDALESFLIKNNKIEAFFILLQEKINHNINIESAIDSFTFLIDKFSYTYETLNNFLSIISKDHKYLVSLYLQEDQQVNLNTYIRTVAHGEIDQLDELVPIIISSSFKNKSDYFDLIKNILYFTNKHVHQMIQNYKISDFEDNLVSWSLPNLTIINYCNYLLSLNKDSFKIFENKFLYSANMIAIYEYALNFELADRRLALLRLLSFQDNSHAILFIKAFPKYKNLITML